jgi:long-chain acyl-CoA synthetase
VRLPSGPRRDAEEEEAAMRLTGKQLPPLFPIADILGTGVVARPDEIALTSLEARWTWRSLDRATDRLAANLTHLGLRPGDRIASLMPNRDALFVHYIACMKAGLVIVPLNYRYTASSIDHALTVSGASALLAHGERAADIAACPAAASLPVGVVGYAWEDAPLNFARLVAGEAPDFARPPVDPDAPAAIFFTSGSTGEPKGVTHTARSLGAMFTIAADAFELTADDILLPGSSCSHIGGFVFAFAAFGVGARVVVAERYDGDEILALLRRERPTVLCMIPAALFSVDRDPEATAADFASLRLCRSGADKVPAELEKEFTELTGHVIDEGYGCTETGLAALNPPSGKIVAGSVGRVLAGIELSVRDDAGIELPPDSAGNLWIRTPSLMSGYWNNEEATRDAIRDGWLDSGDRMSADGEGYLWFRGRKKQIIVHDGSNIYPQEVEEALATHPAVALAGVVGIHDLVHGENVRAYVALKPGVPQPTTGELIAAARALVGYKAPEEIEIIAEIPLNATGKVDRVTLKKMAEARHGADGD